MVAPKFHLTLSEVCLAIQGTSEYLFDITIHEYHPKKADCNTCYSRVYNVNENNFTHSSVCFPENFKNKYFQN